MDEHLSRLLERHFNICGLMEFGTLVRAGSIVSLDGPVATVIGHLDNLLSSPPPRLPTPAFDIDLSLARTTGVNAGASGAVTASGGSGSVGFKLRHQKDIVVSIEPADGEQLTDVLAVGAALAALGQGEWEHRRWGVVKRTFNVLQGTIFVGRKGDGEVTLNGSAPALTLAVSGKASAGITWSCTNAERIDFVDTLGVHIARFKRSGAIHLE